jgi:hypothetical protein
LALRTSVERKTTSGLRQLVVQLTGELAVDDGSNESPYGHRSRVAVSGGVGAV